MSLALCAGAATAQTDYHGFSINAGQELIDNPVHGIIMNEKVYNHLFGINIYGLYQPHYSVIKPNDDKTSYEHGSTTTTEDGAFVDLTLTSDPEATSSFIDNTEASLTAGKLDGAVVNFTMGNDGLMYMQVPEKYYFGGSLVDVPSTGGDLRIRFLMYYADKGRLNDNEELRTNDITGVYATINAPATVTTTVNFVQGNTATEFTASKTSTLNDKLGKVQRTAEYILGSTKGLGPEDLKYEGDPGACDNLVHYKREKNKPQNNDKYAFPLTAVDLVFKNVKPGEKVGWTNLQTLHEGYTPVKYEGSGVESIFGDDADAEPEYYNLQGIKVVNPENGIFIERRGSSVRKVVK